MIQAQPVERYSRIEAKVINTALRFVLGIGNIGFRHVDSQRLTNGRCAQQTVKTFGSSEPARSGMIVLKSSWAGISISLLRST